MTRKLYNEDSMIREFAAEVILCEPYKDSGLYKIILDQTAFFPTGGGQTADAGWLSFCVDGVDKRIEVVDGIESDGDVWHITKCEVPFGTKVFGGLNWEERFSKMQQHTGEHIVSGIVSEKYGFKNVGFHLGTEAVTMDFDEELDRKQLDEIEYLANKVIWDNRQVVVLYPTKDELDAIDYRSKIEIPGQVRIVQIPGVDSCACCAPHVQSTGMVGMLKMTDVTNHRGGVRIQIKCGDRALVDYQEKSAHSKEISKILSVKEVELSDGVSRVNEELLNARYKIKQLEEAIMIKVGKDILTNVMSNQVLVDFHETYTPEQNKILVNYLVEKGIEVYVSLVRIGSGKYQFICYKKGGDLKEFTQKLRVNFLAKGGGKAEMIQGTLSGEEEVLKEFIITNI